MPRRLPLLVALSLSACTSPDLGECDDTLARSVVLVEPFEGDVSGLGGQPMFEGQALLSASCGNGGFCHSDVQSLDSRFGAPAGFVYDVRLACDARAPSTECSEVTRARQLRGQADAYRWRHEIVRQVEAGLMPPGEQGREVRARAPRFVRADGERLPELDTPEGRAILRNWLACGAPIAERAEDPGDGRMPGDYCGDVQIGDCVYGTTRSVEPPDPTWPSIYERVIVPSCVPCHGPGPTDYREESQLDLSTEAGAYDAMVGVAATGAFCNDEERTYVMAGDPDGSLLIEKLVSDDTCGDRMPQGGPYLPMPIVDAIESWIAEGAPR